jgi:hypothetical protein
MKFTKKLSENYTNYGNTITSVYYSKSITDIKKLLVFCKKLNLKVIPIRNNVLN